MVQLGDVEQGMSTTEPAPLGYYFFCNHWSQAGIGYAFPAGRFDGRRYERAFSAAYTVAKMIEAAETYPGLVACLELDAHAYEALAEEDPALLARLRRAVADGRVAPAGGTYGQPFGQDYGWESNVRHLVYGRRVIRELLGYEVRAFLVEEQWFHPQLPQLLRLSGFAYASLQNQNSGQVAPMQRELITWVGMDGTRILTLPANDLVVSCVRQYQDYAPYLERLRRYRLPLLTQWVEVWPPGYDWGASCVPFELALAHARALGLRSVSLEGYFHAVEGRVEAPEVRLRLDDSNYDNTWYQGGGWGVDGDRLLVLDRQAEHLLTACEALAALTGATAEDEARLERWWKRLLFLQNHDVSVARDYSVEWNGVRTTAGQMAADGYRRLIDEVRSSTVARLVDESVVERAAEQRYAVFGAAGFPARRAVELPVVFPEAGVSHLEVRQAGEAVPFQTTAVERHPDGSLRAARLLAAPLVPALGSADLAVVGLAAGRGLPDDRPVESPVMAEAGLSSPFATVRWDAETRRVLVHTVDGLEIALTPLLGPIGKVNEHNAENPALNPAHKLFCFNFGGKRNAPDQIPTVEARAVERGPLRQTLLLHGDLVTLLTTSTPVAFFETRISLAQDEPRVDVSTLLYTGIPLAVEAWAVFEHNVAGARYAADFAFGEEEVGVDAAYPLSYLRVAGAERGFTLLHGGTPRMVLERRPDGGRVDNLVARRHVRGEYEWRWSLVFGRHEPWESARLARLFLGPPLVVRRGRTLGEMLRVSAPAVALSALYSEGGRVLVRLVNYSPSPQPDVRVSLRGRFSRGWLVDLEGNRLADLAVTQEGEATEARLAFRPWQVVTVALEG